MNREMKDSGSQWIQDIPNKWNNERLKYTITARDGGAWGEEPTKDNPGVICMRIADFNYDDGVFQDKPQEQLTKRLYTNNQINRLMLMQNDICIEKSGGGEKTPVGRTVIFDKAYPALFANFMERLRFNPNIIIPHFGEYWFRAMYSCKVSPVYIKQTTGIQNLDVGTMLAVERIYYPSLPEQRQIVHFLDRKCTAIDTAIEKTKESIEKLEEYKKAVITKAVTKGIDPNAKMKDSGVEWIGEIPEGWEIIPNKHLMKKVKNLCPVYNGEDILSLSMKGVYVRDPNDESGKRPTTYNGYQYVQEGDLLMCLFDIDVTPRCVGRVYNDGLTSPAYSRFVMNKTRAIVDYYYYYYLALDFDKTLLHLSKNMRSSLTESDFGSINAPVPSPTEQQQIVHFLDRKCTAIDTAIENKKKAIEKWEEYKKSLIYYAVTGKIDCRNEVI